MDPTIPTEAEAEAKAAPAPTPACPNCGEVASRRARYCTGCGQRQDQNLLSIRLLLGELLEEMLSLDGRLPRSLAALFVRPGHLTREYRAGRIARYVRPFRLYLASSVIFFLALSFALWFNDLPVGPELLNRGGSTADSTAAAAGADSTAGGITADQVEPATFNELVRSALAEAKSREQPAGVSSGWRLFLDPFIDSVAGDATGTVRRLTDRLLRDAPKAVFILLPVFALFLKGLYIRRRRFYVEHLVFVLHTHAFAFLLATILLLLPKNWPTRDLWLIFPIYLIWAMRRVYEQSFPKTILKFFVFSSMYLISALAALFTAVVLAAVTL
jgi:hypothetical protein